MDDTTTDKGQVKSDTHKNRLIDVTLNFVTRHLSVTILAKMPKLLYSTRILFFHSYIYSLLLVFAIVNRKSKRMLLLLSLLLTYYYSFLE
jgi:hypothetical protein